MNRPKKEEYTKPMVCVEVGGAETIKQMPDIEKYSQSQDKYIDWLENPWISVEDRLPDVGQDVLVFTANPIPGFQPVYVTQFGLVNPNGFPDGVTDWMPLPKKINKEQTRIL